MTDLVTLLSMEIPEGRSSLLDSHTNLERVAEYCEGNYLQAENKRNALEETKNYTTQSLASVAYQINTLAFSFLQMLDLQATQMSEMESQVDHINQLVMVHKEKVARREIGVLTATKVVTRQYKILAPANPERPIKYVRRPIDFNALDEIGHGVRVQGSIPRQKQRASSQSSSTSLMGAIVPGAGARNTSNSPVPPAPTSKPPTPPQLRAATGSLTKASREYRTPPAVAPPQVPSNYAANYPLGHPRRASERLSGYSTLPLPHNAPHNTSQSSLPGMSINTQVGLVHPIPQGQYSQYGPGINIQQEVYSSGLERQRSLSSSNPPPPSPGLMESMMGVMNSNMGNMGDYGTVSAAAHRPGKASPPLPPPPDDQYGPSQGFRRGVLPQEQDLPGWVPKNYVEKVVAIYDYYADKDDELSFQENSVIYVLRKNDDGWWEGVMDGITGLFPGNYVEPCM